jgi:hypothetical protein
MLAAPIPTSAIVTSPIGFCTISSALRSAATTTVAVPCWSSCQTGIDKLSRSRSSTSKHVGWEMSSRFTPPKDGCSASTTATSSSADEVSTQIGTASTPPRYLKSSALPSITGRPASGPMSPRPSTREPSETIAIVLARLVCDHTNSGSAAIARLDAATPGVYQMAKSSRPRTGHFGMICTLPR